MGTFERVRESEAVAHADELETSLYLYLAGARVQMSKADADQDLAGEYVSSDSLSNYSVHFVHSWGRWTRACVHGDHRRATALRGEVVLEAILTGLVQLASERRLWPIENRDDQHERPAKRQIGCYYSGKQIGGNDR